MFVLTCNSQHKHPTVLGRFKTEDAAKTALVVFQRRNADARIIAKRYAVQVEDLFCDLTIRPE